MEEKKQELQSTGVRFSVTDGQREVAGARLYLMYNDIHPGKPFGFIEDVFVDEEYRGKGLAGTLVGAMIAERGRRAV